MIAHYVWKNPARARYPDPLEPSAGSQPPPTFSKQDPQRIYASVVHAIRQAVNAVSDTRAKHWFAEHYIGDPQLLLSKEDIALKYGVHVNTVRRGIYKILDELEREMVKRELIDPEVLHNKYN